MIQRDRLAATFNEMWSRLGAIGHLRSGATERIAWTAEDMEARAWFAHTAEGRGLPVEADRNGNLWAWWPSPGPGAVATGSHLDTVPGGGAFDGALGVVSAFLAIDLLRARGDSLAHPLAVAAFAEEEGTRFGVATLGSRLSTGILDPVTLFDRTDAHGMRFEDAIRAAGVDPHGMGADSERLDALAAFVELHVEQGRTLAPRGYPLGVGTGVDPHGRWRVTLEGMADHAGTARLVDRHDPTLVLADVVRSARRAAAARDAVATVGRVLVEPNGSNVVAGRIVTWLDVRATEEAVVLAVVAAVQRAARRSAAREGVQVDMAEESWTPPVTFDAHLRLRITSVLDHVGIGTTPLSTAAGHDAGILATRLPTAMLFVRNPTGVSHAPAEDAALEDILLGIEGLAEVLADLAA